MKVIIAGSRQFNNYLLLLETVINSKFDITEIVSGGAKGADSLGERFAHDAGIPIKRFPADWNNLGRRAGVIRNQQMADYADALIALWDGQSKGTADMIKRATARGLNVFVEYY